MQISSLDLVSNLLFLITLIPYLNFFSRLFLPLFFPCAHYAKVRKMSIINLLIAIKY